MKTFVLGVVMLVGGFAARNHYEPLDKECQSFIGQVGQVFSDRASSECNTAHLVMEGSTYVIIGGACGALLGLVPTGRRRSGV